MKPDVELSDYHWLQPSGGVLIICSFTLPHPLSGRGAAASKAHALGTTLGTCEMKSGAMSEMELSGDG